MGKLLRKVALVAGVSAVFLAASVLPASASSGNAVRGDFHAFGTGLSAYPDLSGHAQLVRTSDGKTIVAVHVAGLVSGLAYPSHVHAKACGALNADGSAALAGGHYKIDTSIAATVASNEIWPGPITADADGVANGKAKVEHSARADAVSVVIHAPDGVKIGCADLA